MKRVKGRKWSDQEISLLRDLCLSCKYSFKSMSKIINRPETGCQRMASVLKFPNKFKGGKKYEVDENFWTPNPISSYWAGFSAADACIRVRGANAKEYSLQIAIKDYGHLEKLKANSGFTGPIHKSLRKGAHWHCDLCIPSMKWAEDLSKHYNIVPNKTLRLAPPNMTDEYLKWCYLIGYCDGDGCINLHKKNPVMTISFISSSHDIISWCYNLIYSRFKDNYLKDLKNGVRLFTGKYPKIAISGLRAFVLYDFLIKFDLPNLDRKWKQPKAFEYLAEWKKKHPDQFKNNDSLYNSLKNQYNNP